MSEEEINKKIYQDDGREVKHFAPGCCDVCFMLFYIYSLSQRVFPSKEVKDRLFKLKRDHTAQGLKINLSHCKEISVMIYRWENTLCPDCGAPMKIVLGYMQKCSEKPDEHNLCDGVFYLKKIKEILEKEKEEEEKKIDPYKCMCTD